MSHLRRPSGQKQSRYERAEKLFWKLVADPAWGLSEHDRELFHAFLNSIGREAAERAHTARPVRDVDAFALWWLERGRNHWGLRIDRRDRERAKRIVEHLDAVRGVREEGSGKERVNA